MWGSLPTDILELLVRSLQSSFDRLRFGAVCRSWRDVAAAAAKQNPADRRGVATLPIMTFIEPVKRPVTRCFYSLCEDKVYRRRVPSESRDWRCFGSSRGWLGMVDLRLNTFLFDPISEARIDLPPLTTLRSVVVSVRRSTELGLPATWARDQITRRLALSSSPLDSDDNCIAMAIILDSPAYARPGCDSWAYLPEDVPPQSRYDGKDVIYHAGRFYALACTGDIIAVDFELDPKSRPAAHPDMNTCDLAQRPTVEITVTTGTDPSYSPQKPMYLVALPSGELARVIRHVGTGRRRSYHTKGFDVQMLKLVGGGGGEWVEADRIGDCCLFVGFNESTSLPASFQVSGKDRTNCIFFTDNVSEPGLSNFYGGGLDIGIYDFEEKVAHKLCHIDANPLMPPATWMMMM